MHEYIAASTPAEGRRRVYRMSRMEMERHGRWRSLIHTLVAAAALLLLQYPFRQVAVGDWAATDAVALGTSARLSLLVDVALVGAYLTVAWRALEMLLAWNRRTSWRKPAYAATGAVVVGACLDLTENLALWRETGAPGWQGDLEVAWSTTMLALVVVGLGVLLCLGCYAWWMWQRRPPDPETEPEAPRQPERIICCSGGGVRSAAFCLGGLQELSEQGVDDDPSSPRIYDSADHVVGVSGGGYIAAAYHAVRWHSHVSGAGPGGADADRGWADLDPHAFAQESPELQWLRRNSRYLLDSGSSALQGLLSVLFGVAVNLVLLTAALGATAWLLGWYLVASGALTGWHEVTAQALGFTDGPWDAVRAVGLVPASGVLIFLLGKVVSKFAALPYRVQIGLRRLSGALIALGALLMALLLGVPAALAGLHNFAASSGSALAGLVHVLGFVPDDACLAQLATGNSACGVSSAGLTTTEAVGQVEGRATASVTELTAGGVAAVVAAVLAVAKTARSALGGQGTSGGTMLRGLIDRVWSKTKGVVLPWAALALVAVVVLVLLLRWSAALVEVPENLASWDLALGLVIAVLAVCLLTDANLTSLHRFYKERLSWAFIIERTPGSAGPLQYRKPLRFSESRPPSRRKGPRLVACAVANINDPGVVPVGRGCTPFVFDDSHIGLTDQQLPSGAALVRSQLFEFTAGRRFEDATIPAAMAMSGAAFSPLVGRENARVRPYRLVLALGNARLGVWLPNPLWIDELATVQRLVKTRNTEEARQAWSRLGRHERNRLVTAYLNKSDQRWLWDLLPDPSSPEADERKYARPEHWQRPDAGEARMRVRGYRVGHACISTLAKPGPGRLLAEALGRTSVYDRRLYITDGGHYDNLGLVEALRRRPREVIVLDASSDPEDSFRALGQAIATARMDLGCEIDFDPTSMCRVNEARSAAAWGNGSYRFDDGTEGVIRLAKVIMVNGLPWDVEAYSGQHPQFPRTSTGDQLYDEFDLEAYRVLGREVTKELLANPPGPPAAAVPAEPAAAPSAVLGAAVAVVATLAISTTQEGEQADGAAGAIAPRERTVDRRADGWSR